MKYAVIRVSNGSYKVESEGWTDKEKAIVDFHGRAQTLHNAKDVETACIAIFDENLNVVEGYIEFIDHREPTPEPNE